MPDNNKNTSPEEPKTKIDAGAFANKIANTAGRYARKGVDFIGKAVNPDNLKKVGSKAKSVVDSVSEGWAAAGAEDHTSAEEADVRERLEDMGGKISEKVTDFVNKAKDKIDDVKDQVIEDETKAEDKTKPAKTEDETVEEAEVVITPADIKNDVAPIDTDVQNSDGTAK